MHFDIKHYPVNWVDGMKISKRHLVELQNSINDQIRAAIAIALNDHNYGLISTFGKNSLDLLISIDHSKNIHIVLDNCTGITADGTILQVNEHTSLSMDLSLDELLKTNNLSVNGENNFYIIISVNQFSRIPFGDPFEEEVPPRHPFTIPAYQLSVVPVNNINKGRFNSSNLIIGKLINKNGELKTSEDFVPASSSIQSNKSLLSFYNNSVELLTSLEKSCFAIIQKIKSKDQKTSLSQSINLIAEKLSFDISSEFPKVKYQIPAAPPLSLLQTLLRVPYLINSIFSILSSKEKEELLAYLGEWTDLPAGVLEAKTTACINDFKYNHIDASDSFLMVFDYLKILSEVLSILAQLEFIGKKIGQSVFIVEHPVNQENIEKGKSRWSPLA